MDIASKACKLAAWLAGMHVMSMADICWTKDHRDQLSCMVISKPLWGKHHGRVLTWTDRLSLLDGCPSAPTKLAFTVSTGSASVGGSTPTAPGNAAVPPRTLCKHGHMSLWLVTGLQCIPETTQPQEEPEHSPTWPANHSNREVAAACEPSSRSLLDWQCSLRCINQGLAATHARDHCPPTPHAGKLTCAQAEELVTNAVLLGQAIMHECNVCSSTCRNQASSGAPGRWGMAAADAAGTVELSGRAWKYGLLLPSPGKNLRQGSLLGEM